MEKSHSGLCTAIRSRQRQPAVDQGLVWSRRFHYMSTDDLQMCLATDELTPGERSRCLEVFLNRLYK